MIRKLLLQNKTFFFIVFIFIIFFGLVLFSGAKRIYDSESKWRHEIGSEQLLSGMAVIKSFFSNFDHHLSFLHALPRVRTYVNGNFSSSEDRDAVQSIFSDLVKATPEIYQISIMDSLGKERVRVINTHAGASGIVPFSDLQDTNNRYYFNEIMNLGNETYLSPVDLTVEGDRVAKPMVPMIRIATQLMDASGYRKGVLMITVYFSKVLQLLPRNVFVQTPQGNLIALNADGSVVFERSNYDFKGKQGQLKISNTENIHYATLQLASNRSFIVAIHHNHIGLKASLHKLVLLSAILLVMFLSLIGGITYINLSRLREKNRAQRALIASLVELTDWRDQETGQHLMRTKHYTKALAKQLRKKPKYRKKITTRFIKNVFDTAPLHDIGKVGIKDSILLKPGKLTNEEFEEMKNHVLIGRQVIQDAIDKFAIKESFMITARNIAAFHHERYDGSGYLEALKGPAIPLEARIFALVDVYDALRSKRPYKNEMTHAQVVKMIEPERGKHFDPDVVDAFLMLGDQFIEISRTYAAQLS